MKKITLIITALNEGEEPLNTIKSIHETANKELFDIILVNDGSKDWKEIPKKYDVRVIHHSLRKGIQFSRDEAVAMSNTPFIGILNARMRFTKGWLTKVLRYVESEHKTLFCTTSVVLWDEKERVTITDEIAKLKKDKQTKVVKEDIVRLEEILFVWDEKTKEYKNLTEINEKKERKYGAKLVMFQKDTNTIFNPMWQPEQPGKCYEIPCVLGANYFVSRKWYNTIGGLEGLKSYGGDEEFLSLKSKYFGGKVKIIKEVEIGNIYRSIKSYTDSLEDFLWNKIYIAFLLLEWKLAYEILLKINDTKYDSYFTIIMMRLIKYMSEIQKKRSLYERSKINVVDNLIIKED